MQIKLYTSDWFYNMGLVGLKRIIEYEKNKGLDLKQFDYIEGENYIAFDSSFLENFHHYYFDYFLQRYDIAEDQSDRIDNYLSYAIKEEKFKDELGYIKNLIKSTNNKIKKIDNDIYAEADKIYKEISNVKKYDQLETLKGLCQQYKKILFMPNIDERITLNKFKAIQSNNFFGQVSYLNVVNTPKTLEEQKEIMFKDYIKPILEMSNIYEFMQNKDIKKFEDNINKFQESGNKPKNIEKIYNQILNKMIKKDKGPEFIENYLKSEDNFCTCSLCNEYKSFGNSFYEGDFIPLGISSDNSRNMFWNLNVNYPICDICRLVLLCTFAGATDLYKSYIPEDDARQYYAFVNMDTSFEDLYKNNNYFMFNKSNELPFEKLIMNIISTAKERSVWQLQNILYVEFNANYSTKNCKMNYFNIPKYVAEFFKDKSESITSIKEEKFKARLVDDIFKNRDLKFSIDDKLRTILHGGYGSSIDCYKAVKVKVYLNVCKKGEDNMPDNDDKKLKFLYMKGIELGEFYRKDNENKINSVAYRLLNATKANNKNEFMDNILRIHMNAGKEIPSIFLDIMTEKDLEFNEISHAFISGLISKDFKKKEEEVK